MKVPFVDLKTQYENIKNDIDSSISNVINETAFIGGKYVKKFEEEFAKKYTYFGLIKKQAQEEKLVLLFAGLYQKAKDRRSRQYSGIIKFVERQEAIRAAIGNASKKLRSLRKQKVDQKNPKFMEANSQLEWNTRVFDQRTRLTEYICEEPVFNTQRLGYQARKILDYIK